jgi:hypothetical protein
LAAARRPGSSSKYTYASFCPALSITIKHASNSSIDQGGGKLRTTMDCLVQIAEAGFVNNCRMIARILI